MRDHPLSPLPADTCRASLTAPAVCPELMGQRRALGEPGKTWVLPERRDSPQAVEKGLAEASAVESGRIWRWSLRQAWEQCWCVAL